MTKPMDVGELRVGGYMMIEGEPCKIVDITKSKPGKHGSAKVRLVAISIFTGSKKSYVSPAESRVDIPMIDKRSGQITSVMDASVQVMDLATFEVFETPRPTAEEMAELSGKLEPGTEVEYWSVMGRNKIMRIKGGS